MTSSWWCWRWSSRSRRRAECLGGLAASSSAYLAGVLFGRALLRNEPAEFGNLMGYALFAPILFVTAGMMTDIDALLATPPLTTLLPVVAILGKVLGAGSARSLAVTVSEPSAPLI